MRNIGLKPLVSFSHYRGNIIKPYDGCLNHPKPFFVDRMRDVEKFWNNIHSLDLKRMLVELNSEKTSLIPDVLCPWGCTKFCLKRVTKILAF
jgi:hypothetical protein